MTNTERYRLSFTFGGLLIPETTRVVELWHETGDWAAVRHHAITDNALSKTRSSSAERYFYEIRARLEVAYPWELDAIVGRQPFGTPPFEVVDRCTALLAITTRYYGLVGDFVSTVVRARYLEGLADIDAAMYRSFVTTQGARHPELQALKDSTAKKLETVTMRILREADLIHKENGRWIVRPPRISPVLRDHYGTRGTRADLEHLLLSDQEIAACHG